MTCEEKLQECVTALKYCAESLGHHINKCERSGSLVGCLEEVEVVLYIAKKGCTMTKKP
mgnify:CR=1 FL=1